MNLDITIKALSARTKVSFLIMTFVVSLAGLNGAIASDQAVVGDIIFTYKLDPKLTASLYMGERWVKGPPKFTSVLQTGGQATVDVKALGRDTKGRPMRIDPQWIPTDPDLVEVSPGKKGVVTLIFKRPGESRLQVVAQGFTRELHLNAKDMGNGIQVVITRI